MTAQPTALCGTRQDITRSYARAYQPETRRREGSRRHLTDLSPNLDSALPVRRGRGSWAGRSLPRTVSCKRVEGRTENRREADAIAPLREWRCKGRRHRRTAAPPRCRFAISSLLWLALVDGRSSVVFVPCRDLHRQPCQLPVLKMSLEISPRSGSLVRLVDGGPPLLHFGPNVQVGRRGIFACRDESQLDVCHARRGNPARAPA
ncbi:hypothetical protein BC628DRAFT_152430 [Trametes gibbosa]|nr:hypothetical protein BC628DRAFT_152430 [Trametes gibbosa]